MASQAHWREKLLDEISSRPRVLIVLDFDGTLVPFRTRPHLAALGADERRMLRRLDSGRSRLAMMSGRSVADLRRQVGVPDIFYGGVFGLEIAGPGWRYIHPRARAMKKPLAGLVKSFELLFTDVDGVQIEDKGVGLSIHFRNVPPERRAEFFRRLAHARSAVPKGFRWQRGRACWEVMPRAFWDKGSASMLLWRRLGRPYLLIIGDERYDEPMLRVAHERGAGLRVGRGTSAASRRLRDYNAVRRFLHGLADRIGGRFTKTIQGRYAPAMVIKER